MLAALALLIAVPGPDSVVVVARRGDPESIALAQRYARARQLPDQHVCLVEAPAVEDVDLETYRRDILGGIEACTTGFADRIEAYVLARGLPLRVVIPTPLGNVRGSMAAVLALGETTTPTGEPVLGMPIGDRRDCGGGVMCDAARWFNPFRRGVFSPDFTATNTQGIWRPKIVTMLHGRSYRDAARLVASATVAEAIGGARGTFTLMNGADPARGALDMQYNRVITALEGLGFTDVERVPFDPDRVGQTYAAFFTGTAGIGQSIEGNTFLPGSIVDNLTSFGALAENFRETGEEAQVSIARWVAKGVAGVHGTTDEPLNNCFPARDLLTSYVEGGTLGEAYFRAMPFAYWVNLVLGDPMAAPYAKRPRVTIAGAANGDRIAGSRRLTVTATGGVGSIVLFVDGAEIARSNGDPIDVCAAFALGPKQILAVAQVADLMTTETKHRPKGWTEIRVEGLAGPSDCTTIDAGIVEDDAAAPVVADAGVAAADAAMASTPDAAAVMMPAESGCGCSTGSRGDSLLALLALITIAGRRNSGPDSPSRRRPR